MSHKLSIAEVIASIESTVLSLEEVVQEYIQSHEIEPFFGNATCLRNIIDDVFERIYWHVLSDEGSFSQVYISPCGEYVLKINFEDKIYPYFAKMAMDNPHNPYLPNIYWHWDGDGVIKSATLMEFLEYPEFLEQELRTESAFANFVCEPEKYTACSFYEQLSGDLRDLARCFMELREKLGELNFDLDTEGNILYRGDQFVISDPLF